MRTTGSPADGRSRVQVRSLPRSVAATRRRLGCCTVVYVRNLDAQVSTGEDHRADYQLGNERTDWPLPAHPQVGSPGGLSVSTREAQPLTDPSGTQRARPVGWLGIPASPGAWMAFRQRLYRPPTTAPRPVQTHVLSSNWAHTRHDQVLRCCTMSVHTAPEAVSVKRQYLHIP